MSVVRALDGRAGDGLGTSIVETLSHQLHFG